MWKIPAESQRHSQTWMAWPWNGDIWNGVRGSSLAAAQDCIERLLRTIVEFEDVALLVRESDILYLDRRLASASRGTHRVHLVTVPYNDIWVRDTLPTFAQCSSTELVAVNWHFNGWGRRARVYTPYGDDARLSTRIASLTGARLVNSTVVAEGGAFAFDEDRVVVATKSVMFDRFRNPGRSKSEIETALLAATGCERVCWLPGDRHEPVTLGHADSILAFVANGTVLFDWTADEMSDDFDVCDYNLRVFKQWAQREALDYQIVRLPKSRYPSQGHQCTSYVNFAWVDGAIILPGYGDAESDRCARTIVCDVAGGSIDILTVDMSAIACAGGSVHCVTQQQPQSALKALPVANH